MNDVGGKVRKCPYCGREFLILIQKDHTRFGGHLSQHERKGDKRIYEDEDMETKVLRLYYKEGKPLGKIAKELGTQYRKVQKIAMKHNIPLKRGSKCRDTKRGGDTNT